MDLFLWFQTGVKMMMKMKTVADSKMMMSAMMWQEPKFMQRVVPTSEYILTKFAIFKSDSYKFGFKSCQNDKILRDCKSQFNKYLN